jgi:micrococcal nuclease
MLYTYQITPLRVVDGDTVVCDIDLGFSMWLRNVSIRIYGVNTPERRGATKSAGESARIFAMQWFNREECQYVIKVAEKPDKYGRVLGCVMAIKENETFILANDLIKAGHGEEYFGGTKGDGIPDKKE